MTYEEVHPQKELTWHIYASGDQAASLKVGSTVILHSWSSHSGT
jgi:hypothetical protein